jgi:hypothetical protein
MRSKNLLVAAAVATALAGATSAYALNPTVTAAIPADHVLVIAGASAARDAVEAGLSATTFCQTGTFNRYRVATTNSPDLRAYSCTLATGSPYFNDTIEGDNVVIYYRSEGGSIWGPGAIAKNVPVARLVVNASCTQTDGTNYLCPVSNYSLANDGQTATGNITRTAVNLGVADLEPEMFSGANWVEPGTPLGNEPAAGVLAALPAVPVFGQAFGILVRSDSPVAALSVQDITSIFTGNYGDWSQVPGSGTTGPITICRRERGSGTQTGADVFFNAQNCSPSALPFVHSTDNPPIFGNTVIENSTSSSLGTCMTANTNSIGISVANAAPTGTKFVTIGSQAPGRATAAVGSYDYWFEATMTKAGGLTTTVGLIADGLIAVVQDDTTVPTVNSAFALSGLGPVSSPNAAVLPVSTTRPVALARRGSSEGNSCQKPQAQN